VHISRNDCGEKTVNVSHRALFLITLEEIWWSGKPLTRGGEGKQGAPEKKDKRETVANREFWVDDPIAC